MHLAQAVRAQIMSYVHATRPVVHPGIDQFQKNKSGLNGGVEGLREYNREAINVHVF